MLHSLYLLLPQKHSHQQTGRKLRLAFFNVDQVSIIESVNQHGEWASLCGAVGHEDGIGCEVIEAEVCMVVSEHVGDEVDVDSGDSPHSQVVKEMSFNHVRECNLYVQEESRGYFSCMPCMFDLRYHKVHCICGTSARASSELCRWKEVMFFCNEG